MITAKIQRASIVELRTRLTFFVYLEKNQIRNKQNIKSTDKTVFNNSK